MFSTDFRFDITPKISGIPSLQLKCEEQTFTIDPQLLNKDECRLDLVLDPSLKLGWPLLFKTLEGKQEEVIASLKGSPVDVYAHYFLCVLTSGSRKGTELLIRFGVPKTFPNCLEMLSLVQTIEKKLSERPCPALQPLLQSIQELFVADALAAFFNDPIGLYSLYHDITKYAATCQKLELAIWDRNLPSHLPALLPQLRDLKLTPELNANQLEDLYEVCQPFRAIRIKIAADLSIDLSGFENCAQLVHLQITLKKGEVFPFTKAQDKLETIILKTGKFTPKLIESIIQLPRLRTLYLSGEGVDVEDFQNLYRATHLQSLNVEYLNPTHYQIWKLHQSLPKTKITPRCPSQLPFDKLHRLYQNVFSTTEPNHTLGLYSLESLRKDKPQLEDLSKLLREQIDEIYPWDHSVAQKHYAENRYETIYPWDHNLLPLDFYLNGSLIKCLDDRTRILTQGPLVNTAGNFWHAALEMKTSIILMLTPFIEGDQQKCYHYYPTNPGQSFVFNSKQQPSITIKNVGIGSIGPLFTASKFAVSSPQHAERNVYHISCQKIADHAGIPGNMLWFFINFIELLEKQFSGSTMIHCSAGAGRAGLFMSALILSQFWKNKISEKIVFNLPELIKDLRNQRKGIIQRGEQLLSLLNFFEMLSKVRVSITPDQLQPLLKELDRIY